MSKYKYKKIERLNRLSVQELDYLGEQGWKLLREDADEVQHYCYLFGKETSFVTVEVVGTGKTGVYNDGFKEPYKLSINSNNIESVEPIIDEGIKGFFKCNMINGETYLVMEKYYNEFLNL